MGLNHIYKVIWSKTKNAWVVVSEIAKRDGKSSVKSVVTSLAGKSVAAVMVAMVMCGGVASANTVYGTGAAATGSNSTAIGDNSLASDSQATAIGNKAKATKSSAVAIGQDGITSTGTMFGSFIVNRTSIPSNGSEASGDLAVAINGKATGDFSTAINGQVSGDHSIAIHGVADGNAAVAIGGNSYAAKDFAVAISGHALGMGSVSIKGNAVGDNSIAIAGEASGVNSITIGENSVNTGNKSVALGIQNMVYGNESVSMGYSNYSSGSGAYIIGRKNGTATDYIKASESTFMGNTNRAVTTGTTGIHVVGNNNSVDSSNVMVMGNNVTIGTGLDGAVVLGNDSSTNNYYATPTNTTISGLTLDASKFYGTTTNGSTLTNGSIVSIGKLNNERQLKNVAAGEISATSTDAINGSQLYEAVRAVTAGASPDVYMHVNDGTSTQGAGNATSNLGKVNEKGGATGQYSIAIGYQTKASGSNSLSIGSQNIVDGDYSTVVGSQNYFSNTARQSYGFGLMNGNSSSPIVSSDSYFIGFGNKANKVGTSNIYVLGKNNEIKSTNVYAVGASNIITDSDATNIYGFNNNITKSPNSIVIGQGVQIDDAVKSLFIGTGRIEGKMSATADDNQELVAIGHKNTFENGSQKSSITLGNNNRSIGTNQNIIIGTNNIVVGRSNLDDGTLFQSEKSGIFGNGYGLLGKGSYFIGNSALNDSGPTSARGLSKNSGIFGNDSSFDGYLGTIPGSYDANKMVEGSRIIGNHSVVAASDVMAIIIFMLKIGI